MGTGFSHCSSFDWRGNDGSSHGFVPPPVIPWTAEPQVCCRAVGNEDLCSCWVWNRRVEGPPSQVLQVSSSIFLDNSSLSHARVQVHNLTAIQTLYCTQVLLATKQPSQGLARTKLGCVGRGSAAVVHVPLCEACHFGSATGGAAVDRLARVGGEILGGAARIWSRKA